MLYLIAIIACIALSLLWYMPGIRLQGENRFLKKSDYVKIVFLFGILYTCLLIIITEITWDVLAKLIGLSGIALDIISNFFRAALLEEFFKFTGFLLARENIKFQRKIDHIMAAGLIGMVYGIVEKAALGNPAGVIIGTLIPMHMLWQFRQGGHYFEYQQAKSENRHDLARKELFFTIFVPFLLHGVWDTLLDIAGYLFEMENTLYSISGGILFLVTIGLGIFYMVRTLKWVRQIARESASEPVSTLADVSNDDPLTQVGGGNPE